MKMRLAALLASVAVISLVFASGLQAKSPNVAKVDSLLRKMTLEEKVGQMTQLTLGVFTKNPATGELDLDKLRDAIVGHHIGSILNIAGQAFTLEQWHRIITQIQDIATKETRLGIPILYGIDAVHGANYTLGATVFPQNLGMASTWNEKLMRKTGEITAYEVRASGIPWDFAPVLGLGRQPLWSRLFETFGEDPYLASRMGAEYVKGLQGDPADLSSPVHVAACMKHYIGYSFPLTGKDRTPAWIPERMLREYFLPPFAAAVGSGVATAMVNSSEINGIPVHSDSWLLGDLLRKELGFRGLVVSDWNDINNLYKREHIAETQREAVKRGVKAGVDMSMVPFSYDFADILVDLVKEGEVPEARIDESVRRILQLKFDLGLFENPYPDKKLANRFACDDFQRTNLQAARESIILVKNERGILPLSKNVRVLVTGPTADQLHVLNGGWTITWQGKREDLYPKDKPTILGAIRLKLGGARVQYVPGTGFDREIDIAAAVQAAKNTDAAIVCLGEDSYCESEGNILDLTLPEAQLKLARAIEATGTPVILVLAEGRPRIIRPIVEGASAILLAFLPGMEGGRAIADILFGDANPSGKLPVTYPRYVNDFTHYDHKYSEQMGEFHRFNPQWNFGFGLSYTQFQYTGLKLSSRKVAPGEPVTATVTVKNVGKVPGKEVVQLYLSDLYASVTPPVRRLKRFRKIFLNPGEEKKISFELTENDLSFIGRDNRPVVESGDFVVGIGPLKETFELLSPKLSKK